MAVVSNIEWKAQEAVLNALAQNADLSALGVQLRRARDEANPVNPPAVTVYAFQSQHPVDYGGTKAFDEVFVELIAQTKTRADLTGQVVAEILGACRDQVRDTEFNNQLNAVVNFTSYGEKEVGTSFTSDNKTDRIRKMTVRILANPSDLNN